MGTKLLFQLIRGFINQSNINQKNSRKYRKNHITNQHLASYQQLVRGGDSKAQDD